MLSASKSVLLIGDNVQITHYVFKDGKEYIEIKDRKNETEVCVNKQEGLALAKTITELFTLSTGITPTHADYHAAKKEVDWVCNCTCPKCFDKTKTFFCICKRCNCVRNK